MMMNMKKQLHLQHSPSVLIIITLLFTTTLAQSPANAPAASGPTPPSPALPGPTASGPAPPSPAASGPALPIPAPPIPAPPIAVPPSPVAAGPAVPGPAASGPASPGPTSVIKILDKAGKFNIFIKLLKSTVIGDQLNSVLNDTNQAITLFAPPDNAFSSLPKGTSLNSFTREQQIKLVQFHVVPMYIPPIQFQTLSNPVRTQAGSSSNGQFPLNLITSGKNVSMTTGIVNATLVHTIYTDGQLAVYEVNKVLLPMQFYVTPAPAPAPALPEPKKKSHPLSAAPSISTVVPSNAVSISRSVGVFFAVAVVAVIAI
ncbi:fasciclin-like arabinogalactan protein 12 [Macadamia integrifolia]|uniref:fasciclin-like arabinogalactan protein 12 n=1 Tax=Macadamia integrifolia TaxID=60698 RepID=UPI001C530A4C|nr:fasciclin-like arabinogalactan protein 12 [Macadamia integrifolia]